MSYINIANWLKKLDLFGDNKGRSEFNLEDTLAHLRHLLPNQGPIKDFIHHNPIHGFQGLCFHDGVNLAASLFGAKRYLDPAYYELQFKKGAITDSDLAFAITSSLSSSEAHSITKQQLLSFATQSEKRRPDVSQWGLRHYWTTQHQINLPDLVSPSLFKLLSSYLDQGISIWSFPSRKDSLWLSLQELTADSALPILPFKKETLENIFQLPTETVLYDCLQKLVGDPQLFTRYLLETVLCFPGWAGMVCALENNPAALRKPSAISLLDFLAVILVLEVLFLENRLATLLIAPDFSKELLKTESSQVIKENETTQIWQEAFEWSFYRQLLKTIQEHSQRPKPSAPLAPPWAQAIFCIDDRECSLRRHLEQSDPGITTFGTAGFFGIDFWFLGAGELFPSQQSPIILKPKHIVRAIQKQNRKQKDTIFETLLGGLLSDLFLVPFLSVSTLIHFVKSIFFRKNIPATASSLNQFDSQVMLEFLHSDLQDKESVLRQGFTVDEMANRVSATLRTLALTKDFSECVYVIGHGASSANNPHFAAYDCGACSGKSGAPNARAFAWMANYAPVRAKLKEMGIIIPEETLFYGVLHDTTQDKCIFFEEDLPLRKSIPNHAKFKHVIKTALLLNAKERARRLDLVPAKLSLKKNAIRMAQRGHSIFEPRPELNHATNATAIIGKRDLTRGLFLDRRAFLQSYDPFSDPKGEILLGILGAIIPVCGGINLEYFFSRIDNERYGAGTKLSHNVVGLMGVSNGVNNDLIPGLPIQMIEAHDPVRLLILIQQEPTLVADVLKRNPFLYEWVNHHWVRFATISPTTQEVSLWTHDAWSKISFPQTSQPPIFSLTADKMGGEKGNLPISFLREFDYQEGKL